MSEFSESQQERAKQFIKSKHQDQLFVLSDIPAAIVRLNLINPELSKLGEQLSKGALDGLTNLPLVTNASGEVCLDMARFGEVIKSVDPKKAVDVNVFGDLFVALDRDMVLRGESSVSTVEFQRARAEIAKVVYQDLCAYNLNRTNILYRLASEECTEPFEKPEDKEHFEQMEACAQAIVDRLFVTSGLKKYKPKVLLTRHKQVNAFVYGIDTGKAIRESVVESLQGDEQAELPIFIHTGLIAKIENQDQLAGVLAHEFSHLLQPAYNETTGEKGEELAKRLEYGADAVGMQMADAAGFNPRGLIEVFHQFPDDRAMQILFGGSHPQTQDRIIELEKLFHRTDVPFANAQRAMTEFNPEMHAAAKEISARELAKIPFFGAEIHEADNNGQLEQMILGVENAEAMLSTDNIHEFSDVLKERRKHAFISHEFTTGELGYNGFLSEQLHIMVATYQKFGHGKQLSQGQEYNYYFPGFKEGTMIAPMEHPEEYLEPTWSEAPMDFDRLREYYFEARLEKLEMDAPTQIRSLESWTDTSIPEVAALWELIESGAAHATYDHKKQEFTSEEKRNYLYTLLRSTMSTSQEKPLSSGYGVIEFGINKRWEQTQMITRSRLIPSTQSEEVHEGHLSKLPVLAGRAQMKKTQKAESQYEDYQSEELISGYSGVWSQVDVPTQIDFSPKLFMIGETHVPKIQKPIDAYQQKGREALRAHLEKRGFTDLEDQDLDFLMRDEVSRYPFDRESLNLTRVKKLLAILESPTSLGELFRNAEGTTRTSEYGRPNEKRFRQDILLCELLRIGAFALVPKTDDERAFQALCLRRAELDPMYYSGGREFVLGRDPLSGPNEFTSYVVREKKDDQSSKGEIDLSKEIISSLPQENEIRLAASMRLAPLHHAYANLALGKSTEEQKTQFIPDPSDERYATGITTKEFTYKESNLLFSQNSFSEMRNFSKKFLGAVRGFARDYFSNGILSPDALKNEFGSFMTGYELTAIFQSMMDQVVKEYTQEHFADKENLSEYEDALKKWLEVLVPKAFDGKELIYLANLVHKSQRDEVKGDVQRIDSKLGPRMEWLAYRKAGSSPFSEQDSRFQNIPERNTEENKQFMEVLAAEAQHDPKKTQILAFVTQWHAQGKEISSTMRAMCMGHFVHFEKHDEIAFTDLVKLWRTVGEVYKEEWKNIEGYKCLDQQLSHWEWQDHNPLLKFGWDKKGKENRLEKTLAFFNIFRAPFEAGRVYRIDSANLNDVKFSWPLFLDDVMSDQVTFSSDFKYMDKEFKEEYVLQIENLRHELTKLIENRDPKVLETIKSMQSGFFKEFLLARKLKKSALKTMDQIEAWLPHFSSRPHEGTERNQISMQIESQKKEITEDTKKELMRHAMRELGFPEDMIQTITFTFPQQNSLSGRECTIEIPVYTHEDFYAPREKNEERRKIYNRYRETIYLTFDRLMTRQQQDVREGGLAKEGDVRVFSDQVVEDEKNKLHIGPAYRLRMVSQPLMDWHVHALEGVENTEETTQLIKRIDTFLPDAHPLKDIFVKNNLMMELWQSIVAAIGKEKAAELGITLEKDEINLNEVLDKLPLYKDISFLKSYTLFELRGLEEAIVNLPHALSKQIRTRIEEVMHSHISADHFEGTRRLLMDLEKRTVWPELKAKRKGHPNVFDEYIARITELYNEPSYARDELLESICMDLATTPEQIRAVWGLRYDEQIRLPKDTDTTETKGQFHALEKMKAGLTFADTQQRAEYLIWFLGGEAPLQESFTSEKMNISLLDRKDLFWSLGTVERKSFLYDLLLGNEGVMQINPNRRTDLKEDATEEEIAQLREQRGYDSMWPKWERPNDMIRYVADQVFEQMFGGQSIDAKLPADHETNVKGRNLIQTIFRELFVQQKEPARRAELFSNIIEAIGGAKRDNVELTPGKLIKLLLEQVGVVGIKAGQVLSEQPDLLPESIRNELAGLKDQTTPFSKRGVLSYLEAAGVVKGDESRLSVIGDIVGSASIKQVLEGTMEGKRVAIKARRPSIDKNFEEDLAVLGRVFKRVEAEGFELPTYLLAEVERLSRDELSFAHEVDHQHAFETSLKKRDAHIGLETGDEHRELPLTVAEVYVPPNTTEEDIGLIVEEFVRGYSLKELYGYRAALRTNNTADIKKYREKTQRIYADPSLESVMENRIVDMNLERFQADLGVEILQEIQDGVIHSDLHSGNIYIDPHPLEGRAILIDLGSVGYSEKSVMPEYLQKETEDGFDAKSDFRDFLTAFFGTDLKYEVIATIVNKYTSRTWTETDVRDIVGDVKETDGKVNKIFYALLKGGAEMHSQFRYLLKAIATGAGHLDQLKHLASIELASETQPEYSVVKTMFDKGLINVEMLLG